MVLMETRVWIAAIVLAGLLAAVSAAAGADRSTDLEGAALLVIDVQAFYFPGGKVPLVEPEAATINARQLVQLFRNADRPVIHVQHLPKDVTAPDPTGIDPQ